ncbi:MAG: DUF4280 domain-containing protein [Phycisphaerales bacterium]|jgi:hypothetical protein|nr:DUF4280 domain-containing protein [Phycisphaerales bacterium]
MPPLVVMGAKIGCSMAVPPAPSGSLIVPPMNKVMGCNQPAANIMDNVVGKNIAPFPLCQAKANPTVIAATAAALGTPTPAACVPLFPAPWSPGASQTMIANQPALHAGCTLNCAYGGTVTIAYAGQATIQVS